MGFEETEYRFAIGGFIINRNHKTHIGELCLEHEGGDHRNAGTCQVSNDQHESILKQLIERINADG